MRRRQPRRQIGKERRDVGGNAEPNISRAHSIDVFGARLLDDREPRANTGVKFFDRRRHDLRHHAGALAAAEHDQAQFSVCLRRGIGRAPPPR